MSTTPEHEKSKNQLAEWFLRLLKGVIVGVGAIVPGLSGGALAVVFGIYEPLIKFLANMKHNFFKNVFFFLPIGIGGIIGVLGFSAFVDFAFSSYAAQFTWLFIGFIFGTFPSLLKTSGEQGRKPAHWVFLAIVSILTLAFMRRMETISNVNLPTTFPNWILSGALFGLGVVVPGMSPSNFLIYLGLYQPMASGIRHLDFGVIIPLGIGLIVCVFTFAKLVAWLFNKYYAVMFHLILGIVVGSTLAIIPSGVSGWAVLVCILLFFFGAACSFGLAKLNERYPHESIIDAL